MNLSHSLQIDSLCYRFRNIRPGEIQIMTERLGLGIIGCGFVAHYYVRNAAFYPDLELRGCFDRDLRRSTEFSRYFSISSYSSMDALLNDPSVGVVLNLTNPRSHFEVTQACLMAGKHVYTEKPLAMIPGEAAQLLSLAQEKGLRISCAPCSVLSDAAQTIWKAVAEGAVGRVRLVYANYDEGYIAPVLRPWMQRVGSGAYWPARDEFEVGCTYEHGGYPLTWLGAFFGPAKRVHAFSACLIENKGVDVEKMAPDFSVGCIEYADGVVARVTCGIVAPHDKSMTVIGDEGVLYIRHMRNDAEPVYWRRHRFSTGEVLRENPTMPLRQMLRRQAERVLPWPVGESRIYRKYPRARRTAFRAADRGKPVDFMLGPKEMVDAIRENRPDRLSGEFGNHIVDLVYALQHPAAGASTQEISSRFAPIAPLPWS